MIQKPSIFLLLFAMLQLAVQAQQTHQLDIKKSKIQWKTPIGAHTGYLLFSSGNLVYAANGQPMAGSFVMEMNSMRVTDDRPAKNIEETETRLRTDDFFAVDRYPISTIVVTKITQLSAPLSYKVNGDLTIKGITQPIEFTATIDRKDTSTHITADIGILRHLWRIHFTPKNSTDLITGLTGKIEGDDIYVTLDLVLNK